MCLMLRIIYGDSKYRMPGRKISKASMARARARRLARARALRRRIVPYKTQVFSEMTGLGTVAVPIGTGGQGFNWVFKMNDLPQSGNYQALYQQYKLLKVQVVLVPRITSSDGTIAATGALGGLYAGRIAYAVQDSPEYTVPPTEITVLAMNGAKVKNTERILKINCSPKAILTANDGITPTNQIGLSFRRNPWLNFDGKGDEVLHAGVSAYVTAPGSLTSSSSVVVYDLYAKYYFCCRDPR